MVNLTISNPGGTSLKLMISLSCRKVRDERLKVAKEKASREICLALIEQGVLDELQDLAWDVLEDEKAERDAKLQQLAAQVMRRKTARYFKRCCLSLPRGIFFPLTVEYIYRSYQVYKSLMEYTAELRQVSF